MGTTVQALTVIPSGEKHKHIALKPLCDSFVDGFVTVEVA